jgi:hypothetical protein
VAKTVDSVERHIQVAKKQVRYTRDLNEGTSAHLRTTENLAPSMLGAVAAAKQSH